MSQVLRSVKNVTKGYSSVQVKVRNATSNDPWGPTGTDMADIAKITFNSSTDFYEVMDMLDKRLNDKGKNWRHVLKSLKVLDYCLHEGSELVVTWARKNVYIIKTLREFIYLDEDGRDVGASIRHSAKELTSLIMDEERLRAERANRGSWKSRVTGLDDVSGGPGFGAEGSDATTPRRRERRRQTQSSNNNDDEDLEYRLALEASKHEAEEAARRSASRAEPPDNDDDLAKAIKLSKEEEELRKRELEGQNQQNLLFDDLPEQAPQPTGFNQGYQQQAAVDWYGNPVQQQQPQQTGWEQMQQPQAQFVQPQNTYNPWAQQMNGFSGQPQQPQPTGYLNNAYASTPVQSQPTAFQNGSGGGFGYQQSPMQEQPTAQAGSNNPWASPNQPSQSPIGMQPTGSNNPFASQPPRPQPAPSFSKAPTLSTLQEQQSTQQFNTRPNIITNFSVPSPSTSSPLHQQQRPQPALDPYQAKLNQLLASGDGQDTFGNVGDLRIPAQHTTPGTFVNSAGGGSMGRLEAARTGNNPFFTAAPGQQPQQQFPAQTGPATGYGGQTSPFGAQPHFGQQPQQQQQQQQYGQRQAQGGSLIDL